ncbi:envelope protein UL43 [Equid gammaherpesvirus 5]|uniref:Envelope protein UL43 n=1 Tax=Equid gammaherpesvirus 5 TaxID=10371 RepID=A0A0B4Q5Q1_9GAMA|nr:envelope protein UL43 [Equid gammaherpesvirus 5]AIU39583.1 envelope protein UL43 [Equid gammaherpesvirus 5]APT43396.1 envelope protein UL43 [Equid gammaherpesvirus 5]UTK45408.1 envelope protein UL43 [Equid gammaherpesvirus 5]
MGKTVLTLASYVCGMLGAAPFVWCFLFRTLFSSCILNHSVDELYVWGACCVQVLMLFFCFRKYSKTLSRYLELLCAVNIVGLFGCLLCLQYRTGFTTYLPILFSLNLILLSVWLPITYETVFLCPSYASVYYQLGFFVAILIHYILLFFGDYTSSFLFIPITIFLTAGLYALRLLKKQQEFTDAILNKRAIFITKDNLYVTIQVTLIPSFIATEMCLVSVMTVCFIVFLVAAGVFTQVVSTLKAYLLIFQFGTFCVSGMGYPSHMATFVFAMAGCILMPMVFVLKDLTVVSIVFFGIFYLFINGVTCEFSLMMAKLKKGINAPKIVLAVCLVVNIFVSLAMNILYKVYIDKKKTQ